MRKTMMLSAAVGVMLVLLAGTALASGTGLKNAFFRSNQQIQCTGVPCYATGKSDLIFERIGVGKRDRILLRGGDDEVRANTYGADKDVIKGTSGYDKIYVNDEDFLDKVYGGKGRDKCIVDSRSEVVRGCSRVIVR